MFVLCTSFEDGEWSNWIENFVQKRNDANWFGRFLPSLNSQTLEYLYVYSLDQILFSIFEESTVWNTSVKIIGLPPTIYVCV